MIQQSRLKNEDADRLLARFYDGETSLEEERLLRRFLASPQADGGRYDADRAVMGYLCAGRRRPQARRLYLKAASIAAAACLTLTAGIYGVRHLDRQDYYLAYVNGTRYTGETFVMSQMAQALRDVNPGTGVSTMEQQMRQVFSGDGLNEKGGII